MIALTLPIRTVNPMNGAQGYSRDAHMIRARRRKAEHTIACLSIVARLRRDRVNPCDLLPCLVTLTRVGAGHMDDDGLAGSCKGIRDGIAEALGVNDGSPVIRFAYNQRKGPRKLYALEIVIERRLKP